MPIHSQTMKSNETFVDLELHDKFHSVVIEIEAYVTYMQHCGKFEISLSHIKC
jgi:hypothetical protein